jgi:hypothetical protein
MEFFATAAVALDEAELHRRLTIGNLATLCGSIDRVLHEDGDAGEISSLWGQFRVHREPIRAGVRFSLPRCPNALAWTITGGTDGPEPVVIHCTINRRDHDPDFVESLRQFVEDWRIGIEEHAAGGG